MRVMEWRSEMFFFGLVVEGEIFGNECCNEMDGFGVSIRRLLLLDVRRLNDRSFPSLDAPEFPSSPPDVIYHGPPQTCARRGAIARRLERPPRLALPRDSGAVGLDAEVVILEARARRHLDADAPQGPFSRVLAGVHGHGFGGVEVAQRRDGAVQEDVLTEDGHFEHVEGYGDSVGCGAWLLGYRRQVGARCGSAGTDFGRLVGGWFAPRGWHFAGAAIGGA